MYRSHLFRLINTPLSRLIFLTILFIPCVDAFLSFYDKLQHGTDYRPAFAFFLAGAPIGHPCQILLLWFLPLFFLLMGSDDAIQDAKTGYRYLLIGRIGKFAYHIEKLWNAFYIAFLTMALALVLNFALVSTLFSGGQFMAGLNEIKESDNMAFSLSIAHPYLADLTYAFVACTMAGLAGGLGSCTSLFFRDKKYAYTTTFFIWFILVIRKGSMMDLFQPFTENNFYHLIPILLVDTLILLALPAIVLIYEVKYNDL